MDKYFALAHNYPGRSSIQPPAPSAKAGSTSTAISSVDGSIKPAAPITLVTRVQRVVQQVMQYLGVVKVCANIDTPPELEMLKTTAYLLSLPTSRQLSLIAGDSSGNGGHARAYKAVCETLDRYNRHARKYNEALHRTNKLDANQKTLDITLESQRAQSWATAAGLKEKEQQLAQWNIRCRELRSILQNRTLKRNPDKLKAELKQIKADIASGTGAVEALRQKQKKIESKMRICIKQLDLLHYNGNLAKNVLASSQLALNDDIKVLDEQLAKAIKAPGSGHAGALAALRNGLRDVETLRGLRTDWRYWEMLGVSPGEYDRVAANSAPIQAWLDLRFSAKEALSFANAGYTDPTKLTYLRGTGVTGPIARQMHAFGYTRHFFPQEVDENGHQVSAATYGFTLGMHHDAWAENDAVKIGSGAFNVPMGGYYKDTTAGAASMQVFKKERFVTVNATDPTDNKPISLQAGQEYAKPDRDVLPVFQHNKLVSTEDLHAPRIGLRNVLASNLAQALGLTVIVRSEFSARSVPLTAEEIDAVRHGAAPVETFSFGISMQGVEGVYGYVNGKVVLPAEPETGITMIEELIDLQLFDSVAGQGDRHLGNIMVDKKGHVFGIDNDQCFPDQRADNPGALAMNYDGFNSGTKGALFPKIITTEQRGKWLAMDEQTVTSALRMATQKQRNAALARFRKVQAHIRGLPDGQVVDRSTLNTGPVITMLRKKSTFVTPLGKMGIGDTSYFGRYLD